MSHLGPTLNLRQKLNGEYMANLFERLAKKILTSSGVKRRISALIGTVTALALTTPELAGLATVLQAVNAWLGGASLAHATVSGTALRQGAKSISFAALIQAAIGVIAAKAPELAVAVPFLQVLAATLGAFGLGVASVKTKK